MDPGKGTEQGLKQELIKLLRVENPEFGHFFIQTEFFDDPQRHQSSVLIFSAFSNQHRPG